MPELKLTPLTQLHHLYTTAVHTGDRSGNRLHYAYLADEIHKTIRLIMTDHDPQSCVSDLVNVLRADADQIPDGHLAMLNRVWAEYISEVT